MLNDQRLIFVTGKGGVGKTTVAAALGVLLARSGRTTLCVDIDGSGGLASLVGGGDWGYAPTETITPRLYGMTMSTEDALREYLRRYLPVPFVGRLGPLARTFDFVADAAPGVREILSVGKLCTDLRDDRWDAIVVDAEATGHAVSQIGAPVALGDVVGMGIIHDQTDWMADMITNPDLTSTVIVSAPEELAVTETMELHQRLADEVGVTNVSVIANRVLPTLMSRQNADIVGALADQFEAGASDARLAPLRSVVSTSELLRQRRRCGSDELRRLREAGLSMLVVGEHFGNDADGLVAHVVGELAAELDVADPLQDQPGQLVVRGSAEHTDPPADPKDLHPENPNSVDPDSGDPSPGDPGLGEPPASALPTDDRPESARSTTPGRELADLFSMRRMVLALGAGGVGKTTVAAALGLSAAAHHPGRVLVLTVDPAKRLGQALGLEMGSDGDLDAVHKVPSSALRAIGCRPKGELWVAMLDTRAGWVDLVDRLSPSPKIADRIHNNRLFRNLTSRFVQSHGYLAMERLWQVADEYDYVVIDTPPSRSALDILEAPSKMSDFFGSSLLRWLTVPYRSPLMSLASRPFNMVADRILGSRFLADVAEFFTLFQQLSPAFVDHAREVERLLRDEAGFVVVATPESTRVDEAAFLIDQIAEHQYQLIGSVANRTLEDAALYRGEPDAVLGSAPAWSVDGSPHLESIQQFASVVAERLEIDLNDASSALEALGSQAPTLAEIARRSSMETRRLDRALPPEVELIRLPLRGTGVDSIESLARFVGVSDAAPVPTATKHPKPSKRRGRSAESKPSRT